MRQPTHFPRVITVGRSAVVQLHILSKVSYITQLYNLIFKSSCTVLAWGGCLSLTRYSRCLLKPLSAGYVLVLLSINHAKFCCFYNCCRRTWLLSLSLSLSFKHETMTMTTTMTTPKTITTALATTVTNASAASQARRSREPTRRESSICSRPQSAGRRLFI